MVARLLSPSDYGLVAMVSIFIMVAQTLVDSGFSNALIQRKDRTENDFVTVFYFNFFVSLVLYVLFYILAGGIASFYNQAELVYVTRLSALNVIIQGFAIVQRTKLQIELRFDILARITILGVVLSGVLGIVLARFGFGPYALIFQTMAMNLTTTVGLWIVMPWKPNIRLYSWASFKKLFGFGSKLLLGGLLHTLYNNLYTLIIGKLYSASSVGLYAKANNLAKIIPQQFVSSLDRVSYPVLCSQTTSLDLEKTFFRYLRLAVFLVFPIMCLMATLSRPIVLLLLSEKWADVIPLFQILCFAYMFEPLQKYYWQILNVAGRSDLSLKSEVIKKALSLIILFSTVPFGIKWMCWGMLLYSVVDVLIVLFFVVRLYPELVHKLGYNVLPIFAASLGAMLGAKVPTLFSLSDFLQIFFGVVLGGGVYLFLCRLLRVSELKYLKNVRHRFWNR